MAGRRSPNSSPGAVRTAGRGAHFDALIEAARDEFTEHGTGVSLADIARRAATLYRKFPTREGLVEVVYVAEVDALCRHAAAVAEQGPRWPALVAWIHHFVTYVAMKRVLLDALDCGSDTFSACKQALFDFGGPLLTRAQQTADARADLTIDDVMRYIIGVTSAPFDSDDQRERILDMAIAGIAAPAAGRFGAHATYRLGTT